MKKLAILLFFGMTFLPNRLFACSCIGGQRTVKEEIKYSDAVVTGKIISKELIKLVDSTAIKMFGNGRNKLTRFPFETTVAKYQLTILLKYKGKFKADTIDVYTGLGGGDCGNTFEIGQSYIVYGEKETFFGQENNNWPYPKGDNIIWTNICSRTTTFDKGEIKEIEKIKKN